MKFQSTFPRGERRITVRIRLRHPNFNPRSRVGNDRSDHVYGLRPYDISIHVPAWGTTVTQATYIGIATFQSTFPRGERRLFQRIRAIILNFNPRSRVGNDPTKYSWTKIKGISIHVPAWGTTINNVSGVFLSHISIHVPAWGTTV